MRRRTSVLSLLLMAIGSGCRQDEPSEPHTLASASPAEASRAVQVRFTDVGPESGLSSIIYGGGPSADHLLESTGQGAGFVDYDDDGRLDIILPNGWLLHESPPSVEHKGRTALYRNLGDGTFRDVAAEAGVDDDAWGCGVCTADYDNDGRIDLYVTNFGPNRLYRNLGDGTFEETGAKAGVADPSWGAGCAWFDAERDGDLDLYVANYVESTMDAVLAAVRTTVYRSKLKVMAGPFGLAGARDRFYRNNGDGTFTDATAEAGMEDEAEGYGLGVLASDLDLDGDIDVYVANDSNPNYLYRNNGDGTFREIAGWNGAGVSADGMAQAGMGVDSEDFDGDGIPDIVITNFSNDHSTFYKGTGNLYFEDVSARTGLSRLTRPLLSWGCSFLDYDNDASLELLIVNGHIYPQVDEVSELDESYAQPALLLEREDGQMIDVASDRGPGFQMERSMRGLAVGDYDNDGDLDLLISAMAAPPLLLRNDGGNRGHWLQMRLLDADCGRDAVGARVAVTTGGRSQRRELRSGSTYQSQNAMRLHFGLGATTIIDRVQVWWPSGRQTALDNVEVDQILTLREPSSE